MINPENWSLQVGWRVAYKGEPATIEAINYKAPASASSPFTHYPIVIKMQSTGELINCQDDHVKVMFGDSVLG